MITRQQALQIIEEHVVNKNIIKHMVALEAAMGALCDKLGGVREEWMMAGLLHDGDYCDEVPKEKQGIEIANWVKEKGYDIPGSVAHAMAAHNWHNTKVEPESMMDWAIFCADSLTGLVVACALILPDKKLSVVIPEFVLKKFGQPAFAAGTRREEIKMCEEKLGITLEDFIKITLSSMQGISQELGL